MKKAIIGIGLLICEMMGFSTQRIIDTLFTVNDWTMSHSGFNPMMILSGVMMAGGIIFCVQALKERK